MGVANDKRISREEASRRLLKSAKIPTGWQIGKTMVFMKPEAMKEMQKRQRETLAAWTPVVEIVEVSVCMLYSLLHLRLSGNGT